MRKEMDNNTIERQESFPGRLGILLCMWFLAGMPLSNMLSGIYSFAALPFPPLLFFLSGMIYLTGGLLGGIWSNKGSRISSRFATVRNISSNFKHFSLDNYSLFK